MSDSILVLLSMGFLGGALFATSFIGIIISDNKEQSDRDRGIDVCVPCGDRDRCEYNGHHQRVETEEMMLVLQNMRCVASPYEKRVLDKIEERIDDDD